jgi:hypothetical protein
MNESPDTKARAPRPGRRAGVTDANLNPNSLVGSWLHILEDGDILTDGVIVGEPGPGVFLVEVTEKGQRYQRLFSIKEMVGDTPSEWHFYDSDSEMRDAYAAWLTRTEREQA